MTGVQEAGCGWRISRPSAGNPFQSADSQEVDDRSRTNQVKIIGKLGVVFYTDNADREVRILEVHRADM